MKVAVIGAGEMGRWLADFSKCLGEVTVSDISAAKASKVASELRIASKPAREAIQRADIVLIAVPIPKTPGVLKSAAKIARKGALLADVASVKSDAVNAMRGIKAEIELVSMHPLFGPGASSLKNKDIVVVPVRPGKLYKELKRALAKKGARITEMDEDTHDRVMAIVQCMSHFVLLAYMHSMKSVSGLKQADRLRTPIFSNLMNLAKASMTGNPDLYGELQVQNKYAKVVRSSMMESFHSLDAAFSKGDAKAVRNIFKGALAQFGQDEVKRSYERLYKQFEDGRS